MENAFADLYREIEHLDPIHGLNDRIYHVTADGIARKPIPHYTCLGLDKKKYLELYYYMALMRRTDEKIPMLKKEGFAVGKHLPSIGNEATAIGVSCALKKRDWLALAIRDMGAFMVRDMSLKRIFAQACARQDGPTHGWDANLHFVSRNHKTLGINISHLGAMTAVSAGLAFSEQYRNRDGVAVVFIGDGTTSTGIVHEAQNIASVKGLRLVVVIENNQWAFGVPNSLQFAVPTLALRALGYGRKTEGYLIDGTNVLSVYATLRKVIERSRRENSAFIIEARTMRLNGHSEVDPFKTYVPAEQLRRWSEEKDPIANYREFLIGQNIADEEDLAEIDSRIKNEIEAAVDFAEKSPKPDPRTIEAKVFYPSPIHETLLSEPPAEGQRISYLQAIHDAMKEEMDADRKVCIFGQDIGVSDGPFKMTKGFSQRYDGIDWKQWAARNERPPQLRVNDMPIAEAGMSGFVIGAAFAGLRPIMEFEYADFASRAYSEIVNYMATQNARSMGPLGIVIRMPSGWVQNGGPYHCVNPESWFASTPGLKIVAPITAFDAKGLFKSSMRDRNPVLFLEYKAYYHYKPEALPIELNLSVPDHDYVVPIGKARTVKKGRNLTVISYGSQLIRALNAVHTIEKELGDDSLIEVIDLRTIIPYDKETITESVKRTGRALVTCEASHTACFGTEIISHLADKAFEFLAAPPRLVASADTPTPVSPVLEQAYLPTDEKVAAAIRELLNWE